MAGGFSWPRRSDGLTFCGWLRPPYGGLGVRAGGFFSVTTEPKYASVG